MGEPLAMEELARALQQIRTHFGSSETCCGMGAPGVDAQLSPHWSLG